MNTGGISGGVADTRLGQKKSEAKDSSSEDRHSRGQGQKCSRPRTQRESDLKKKVFAPKIRNFPKNLGVLKKKRSLLQIFVNFPETSRVLQKKNVLKKSFTQAFWRSSRRNTIGHDLGPFSPNQKIVRSSSRGQGIFENLQA